VASVVVGSITTVSVHSTKIYTPIIPDRINLTSEVAMVRSVVVVVAVVVAAAAAVELAVAGLGAHLEVNPITSPVSMHHLVSKSWFEMSV
jgi:hypothetical protein